MAGQELGRVAPGFDAQRVLTLQISSSWGETGDRKAARQETEKLLAALRCTPGVESAAAVFTLPGVSSTYSLELTSLEGRAETEPKMLAEARWVSPVISQRCAFRCWPCGRLGWNR